MRFNLWPIMFDVTVVFLVFSECAHSILLANPVEFATSILLVREIRIDSRCLQSPILSRALVSISVSRTLIEISPNGEIQVVTSAFC